MIMADGLKQFLVHLESYLVYQKEHEVGHCHQLGLPLFFCCQYIELCLKRKLNL